jgi:protein ImuB
MAIPSYDDLTPSIPDVKPGEVFSGPGLSGVALAKAEALGSGLGARPGSEDPGPRLNDVVPETARRDVAPGSSDSGDHRELYAALHDADGAATERLMAIARDFSPRIERHRGGTVVLDVSGLQRLFGEPRSIAHHLAHAGAAQVAVAVSQTAAILLARARHGVTVDTGDPAVALGDLPLAFLQQLVEENESPAAASASRITGDGPRTTRRAAARTPRTFDVLQRWGLTTIGELASLPAAELSARLGPAGMAHQRLARGVDARPLVPDPGVRRFVESFELEWPIDLLEPLSFVFARLLEPLAAALEQADRGGVALHLRLRLTNRHTHLRTLGLPAPMRDPRVLRTLLLLDLESHPPAAAVDVVTIEIDPVPGRIVQFSLLERPVPSPEPLATLQARLGALVGETRCGSPQLVDTHRADGWVMTPASFTDRALPPKGGSHASRPTDQPVAPAVPRSGQARELALRRFRPPVAIRVAVEGGRPVRVAIDRRGMPGGDVRQSAGPWRSSGGWWNAEPWDRDAWDVAFADGAVCRIFQDRDGAGWFVEGVYD